MTPLSQTILEQYQARKTKKQKSAFISLLQQHFPDMQIQEGGFPKCRNLIIGNPKTAKILLCAHYDTCARLLLPNFIMPKNPLFSILYSVLLILPMIAVVFLLNLALNLLTDNYWVHYWLSLVTYAGSLILMVAGPANKHTANDNTSGVIVLCELLQVLTPDLRKKAAFIFFDHEETGLIGSSYFRSRYKTLAKEKLLINYDCVSDGNNFLICASKQAQWEFGALLKDCFLPEEDKDILFSMAEKTYYPSDQIRFKKSVAVASLKHNRFIGYYMNRIHTSKDTVFEKQNIKLLCNCTHRVLKHL